MKTDLKDISQIFGFGFWIIWTAFWNQNGNIGGVQKADENWLEASFPDFRTV